MGYKICANKKYQQEYYQTLNGHLRRIYATMNRRCNNSKHKDYKYYGGRGIQNKFVVDDFIDYIINNLGVKDIKQIKGLDIDRIDNNGHYEKGNIRFVTHKENCNNKRKRYNKKCEITKDEERCYRLRHHEFAGLTIKETAKIMKITREKVRLLLKSLKAKAPQLFPILTFRQHLVYWLYVRKGLPIHKIATHLAVTYSSVWNLLNRARKKGMPFLEPRGFGDMATYENGMDNHIIHKF